MAGAGLAAAGTSVGAGAGGAAVAGLGAGSSAGGVTGGALGPCDRPVEWGLPDSVAIAVVRWRPKPHLAKVNASNSRNRHPASPGPGHHGTIWGRRRRQPSRSGNPVRPRGHPRREVAIPCVRRAIPAARWQSRASAGPRWQVCADSTAKNAQNCHLAGRSARDCHLAQSSSPRRPSSRRASPRHASPHLAASRPRPLLPEPRRTNSGFCVTS